MSPSPDPRTDLVGAVAYLCEQLCVMSEELAKMADDFSMRTYSVEELAEMHRCAPSTLRASPWKLPRFGRSDLGVSPRLWRASTVRAWYSRPEDERRREWDSMSAAERRRAMGRTA